MKPQKQDPVLVRDSADEIIGENKCFSAHKDIGSVWAAVAQQRRNKGQEAGSL